MKTIRIGDLRNIGGPGWDVRLCDTVQGVESTDSYPTLGEAFIRGLCKAKENHCDLALNIWAVRQMDSSVLEGLVGR